MADTTRKAKTIHIFVNRRKLEVETTTMTGVQLLALAGFEGQSWDVLLLQGEGDPSGGELVVADQELTLKEGQHFRVLPGNRTFGA